MKRMAKEGRLRKLHRRDWPGFLRRVVPDRTWQQVNRCVNQTTDPRVRWSPKHILLCWIVMGWSDGIGVGEIGSTDLPYPYPRLRILQTARVRRKKK